MKNRREHTRTRYLLPEGWKALRAGDDCRAVVQPRQNFVRGIARLFVRIAAVDRDDFAGVNWLDDEEPKSVGVRWENIGSEVADAQLDGMLRLLLLHGHRGYEIPTSVLLLSSVAAESGESD